MQTVPYVLNYISGLETKLQAITMIMNAAQIPWSQTLWKILTESLNYSHPLVLKIRSEIESYPVRCVLYKYQCSEKSEVSSQVARTIYSHNFGQFILEIVQMLCLF